jgi:preprotein translocase SecE subunit
VADRPAPDEFPQLSRLSTRSRLGEWLHQSRGELRKVAWPSVGQVVHDSALVLVVSAVVVATIFGVESGLTKAASSIFG